MKAHRNNKIRDAINLIADVQRESSGWFSLTDWVDIVEEVLIFQSQYGQHILLYNRLVGKLLSELKIFAKVYDRTTGVTSYMIDIPPIPDFDYYDQSKFYIRQYLREYRRKNMLIKPLNYGEKYERTMKYFNQYLRKTRHNYMNIIFITPKFEGF